MYPKLHVGLLAETGSAKEIPLALKANFGKILGVDADNGFKALYVILAGKEAVIKRLQKTQVAHVSTVIALHPA